MQLLPTLGESDMKSLEPLNRMLWAWVEGAYHQAPRKGLDTGSLRDAVVPPRGCAPADVAATVLAASKDLGKRGTRAPAVINGWDTTHCNRTAVCTERTASGNVFNEGLSDGDSIVAMSGESGDGVTVTGLDAASKARWTKTLKPSTTGDPVVDLVLGRLLVQEVSQDPPTFALEAMDATTGVRLWRYEAPKSTITGGRQHAVSRSGTGPARIYLLRADRIDVLDMRTGAFLGTIGDR